MKKRRTLAILNLIALLGHITVSYLSQSGLINNVTVGQVSDSYNSLFTPAGITFSIWGLIYAALLFFCIYHLRMAFTPHGSHEANETIDKTGIWFLLNNVLAVFWILVWTHGMIFLSLLFIVLQLVTLTVLTLRLGIHDPGSSVASKVFTQFPLSIYFGWITLATVANVSVYLVAIQWNGMTLSYTPVEWTRIMIGVVVLLTVLVIFNRQNVFFGFVIIWGLYGIILKRQSVDPGIYRDLIRTAWIGMSIVGVSCILQFILNVTSKKMQGPNGRPASLQEQS